MRTPTVTEAMHGNPYVMNPSITDLIDRMVHTARMAEVHWAENPQGDEWIKAEEKVDQMRDALMIRIQNMVDH